MQTSENLLQEIHLFFPEHIKDLRHYSPLKLAYLGDAVFELIIRTLVMEHTGGPTKKLHRQSSSLVNAGAQARLAAAMQEYFTEKEAAVFRRGRNAKPSSMPRHAEIRDYHNATGLEALFGYLYLTGQTKRAVELLHAAMDKLDFLQTLLYARQTT